MPTYQSNNPIVAVTMGDPAGIGPEVILKAFSYLKAKTNFFVIGDEFVLRKLVSALDLHIKINKISYPADRISINSLPNEINLLDLNNVSKKNFYFGRSKTKYARASVEYIDVAASLANSRYIDAIVTAPVSKAAIEKSGIKFSGHTEYLARISNTRNFAMMFNLGDLNITLATRHIALKDISRRLKKKDIIMAFKLTYEAMELFFKIKDPKIGVCALNPHASDAGLFGCEEKEIIKPAINSFKKLAKGIQGPYPADALFLKENRDKFDAIIAMYHDQAMIPVKLIAPDKAVNVTLGLPFIRTSPAHGTAFDIAAHFKANPRSMAESIKLAYFMAKTSRQD